MAPKAPGRSVRSVPRRPQRLPQQETQATHGVSALWRGQDFIRVGFHRCDDSLREKYPEAPQGCVFVTDRIQRADEVYRDLEAALPGKVAIWTSEHKDLFSREVLRRYPVVVVTGQFYLGPNGHLAHSVSSRNDFQKRALTIVDERPEEVTTYEILLSEAQVDRFLDIWAFLNERFEADKLCPAVSIAVQDRMWPSMKPHRLLQHS
jgi:hypothetical protein